MGRKRKRGPKRRPRKTGVVRKGSSHISEGKRETIIQLRDAGHTGYKIAAAGKNKSAVSFFFVQYCAHTCASIFYH